jgi:hypothetical protein
MSHGSQFHPTTIEIYFAMAVFALVMCMRVVVKLVTFVTESFVLMLIIRHFLGHHYHGERRTDATFWEHGSTTSRKHGHGGYMDRWEHKAIGHRMLWRWGCTLAVAGLIYGIVAERAVTEHSFAALIAYVLACLFFAVRSKIRLRVHNRRVVTPTVKSLAPVLRISPHAVRRMLHIRPEDVTDEGEVGYIEFPDHITPADEQRATMERIIDAHLPVDIELELKLQQSPKIGVIRAGLKPPFEASWERMLAAMEKCPKGDVVLGLDRFKEPYQATFTGLDDPHWGFSVQSGSGKSNFLGIVCAQILHQDPQNTVSVIDPKRVSLIDFLGSPGTGIGHRPLIPGVKMANNPLRPQAMRDLIDDTHSLMERRALEAEADRGKKFPVHLLVIDELNMFRDIMKTFWDAELAENKAARAADKTIPELSKLDPMWLQIRAILRMGRFTNIHMVVVAQDLRDDAFGGSGARNYLGFRGLGSYNKKQWDMLIGPDYQLPQAGIGRWIFINKGQKTWVQITRGDEDEDYDAIYAYASHAREEHDERAALALGPEPAALTDRPSPTPTITLSFPTEDKSVTADYSRRIIVGNKEGARYLGLKESGFISARRRTESDGVANTIPGQFYQGSSPAWYADDLDDWWRNRPGNKRKRGHLRVVDEG